MTDFLSIRPLPCIINGQPFTTNKTYTVTRKDVEYARNESLHEVCCVNPQQAIQAVDACYSVFKSWKKTTISQRRAIFAKANVLLQQRAGEYAAMTMEETCLPKNYAGFELMGLAVTHLEEVGACLSSALKSEHLPSTDENMRMSIYREPFGVVLGIAPWNAPFLLALRACLYAIAAGNTCVLKTSECSPRIGLCVGQLLHDAGLPSGVLSIIHVDPLDAASVTEALISHPAIRKINFTGSSRVGKIVAGVAARYLKPCVLELGGKAPNIVLDDADIEVAANNLLFGGYVNSCQICMAVANIFVHHSVKGKLEETLSRLMMENQDIFEAKREQQDKPSAKHGMRALFSTQLGTNVESLYKNAISNGAKVIAGKPGFEGELVQPCVLGSVNDSMDIFHKETFGPILSVIGFDTIEEAVEQANRTEYGLAAGVFGKDIERAFQVAMQLEAGQVHVNGQSVHDHGLMPHGGWKSSGYGRFNGMHGVQEFTQLKGITVQKGAKIPFEMM